MTVRREEGFTMVATILVLTLVLLISGIAITVAVGGLNRAVPARDAEKAQAAADAGADIAGYRMSKTLLAPSVDGLLGLAAGTLRTIGCVSTQQDDGTTTSITAEPSKGANVTAPLATLNNGGSPVKVGVISDGQNLCESTNERPLTDGSHYRYAISTAITVPASVLSATGIPTGQLIVRQVAGVGRAGDVTRRVIVSYWLDLSAKARVFVRRRYVRCPPPPPTGGDLFANCPSNPGY